MTNYTYITDNTSYEYTQALQLFSTTTLSLGLDTETTGLDCFINNIRLLQVSTVDFTYMFDAFVMDIKPLCEVLIDRARRKEINIYAHNFKFDIKMLWAMGIDFGLANVLDTMNMAKIYTGGSLLGYSLADCCEKFINKSVDKTEQTSQWDAEVLTDSQLGYAALDPQLTAQLGEKLHQHIIREHLERVLELETKVLPATACMEFYGIKLDVDKLRQLEPKYKEIACNSKESFLEFIPVREQRLTITGDVYDDGFNPASSDQVLDFMRNLKIPNPMKGMPDQEDDLISSTGANVLAQLDSEEYKFIEPLLSYKKYTKLLTGYIYNLPKLLNAKTGLIHTNYNQIVSTGRFSSSNPNLQNIARPEYGEEITIRSCFVPRSPDNIFVGNDYSQIELRVIAELLSTMYDDDLMLEEFKQGKDPYLSTASLLSGTPYEDMIDIVDGQHIPKKSVKQVRQNAKAVRLGANYAMGARKFRLYAKHQYKVSMSLKEAKDYVYKYTSGYPGLGKYHNAMKDKSLRACYTFPPFNRPRKWDIYPGPAGLINGPIQGSAGDCLKLAMAWLYIELDRLGYGPCKSWDIMLLLNIHDELIIECKTELQELAMQLSETYMVKAAKTVLKKVPVDAKPCLMPTLADKA